ncbi:hypothetical protein [Leptolyngbya sp. NIES-2104]|uniref:hypothetical protein n=1 Tax=Leptolyngbya sp. NIES-2104 TaxID=1552121 RepID=UPI0006EC47B0|nr:hypothetical protein [Leptolyngbya sp. NIES-2104]GAP98628.1 hypothetical protein NIES2104_51830 [Leptolyngbya sp. NIES-2104]
MSIIVSPEDLELFREQLGDHPNALSALDVIEDCDGDLEDAAISLAIRSGQLPEENEGWIVGLAKRWRHILCEAEIKEDLEDGLSGKLMDAIVAKTDLPMRLAVPVAIYVIQTGVEPFCQPMQEKIFDP